MDERIFFDTHYEQMARWKHAVIGDYIQNIKVSKFPSLKGIVTTNNGNKIKTTLHECECKDFQNRKKPCTHMMTLALEAGIYDSEKEKAIDKVRNLSDRAYEAFSFYLYCGYYEDTHKAEKYPQKIFKEIQSQGLIEFENLEFKYSKFTQDNIIAVIYATYSDSRYKS